MCRLVARGPRSSEASPETRLQPAIGPAPGARLLARWPRSLLAPPAKTSCIGKPWLAAASPSGTSPSWPPCRPCWASPPPEEPRSAGRCPWYKGPSKVRGAAHPSQLSIRHRWPELKHGAPCPAETSRGVLDSASWTVRCSWLHEPGSLQAAAVTLLHMQELPAVRSWQLRLVAFCQPVMKQPCDANAQRQLGA